MNKIKFATTPQTGHLDTWGHCARCGSFVRNDDIWHENCSRTAELTALEAEIGRAVIDAGVIFSSVNPAIDEFIAQWRKLHAEGAEEGR